MRCKCPLFGLKADMTFEFRLQFWFFLMLKLSPVNCKRPFKREHSEE